MKRLTIAAVALLTLVAVPGLAAGEGAETGKIQGLEVGDANGFEVSVEFDQQGSRLLVADWRGFSSGDWLRCVIDDPDELGLTMRRQGVDTVFVSGSYVPDDFDTCDGSPDPEFWDISFEFVVVADMVSETYRSATDTETILKGDGENEACSWSRRIVTGSQGIVLGEIFGEDVDTADSVPGGWRFGHWSEHGESC